MKWTIAFDSGCDLRDLQPQDQVELKLVPLKIILGDQELIDDGSISLQEMQSKLDSAKCKTGTACPSVGDWKAAMAEGDNVLAITISGTVSGSYQSACAARDMLLEKNPSRNICVFNSVSGSGGMLSLVNCALEQIQNGASFADVVKAMEDKREGSQIFFLLQNVDNLMSNGRLKPLIGRAVKALRLCLLATVSPQGDLGVIGKTGRFEKAMDKSIEECMKRGCTPKLILISHCLNEEGAEILKSKLLSQFPGAAVKIMETGLLCGYYAEKGGLIVALEG